MDWYVVRHPETGGAGVVAECALPVHRMTGWIRVSDAIPEMEKDQVVPADYAEAPDLDDTPPVRPATKTRAAAKATADSTEEK